MARYLRPLALDDENEARIAASINIVLWISLGLVLATGLVNICISPKPLPHFIAFVTLMLWLLANMYFYRRGRVQLVSRLLPATAWLLITVLVLFSGGINSPHLAGYIPIILVVGLMFGLRYGIGITLLNVIAGLGILILQTHGYLPEQRLVYEPISMWTVYILWFTLSAVLIHLGTQDLRIALDQSRHYAKTQSSVALKQSTIAHLCRATLEANGLSSLFEIAVTLLAQTLGVEYCALFELPVSGDRLVMRAGVGWKDDLVGKAAIETGGHSLADYTLMRDSPVVVEDLRAEMAIPMITPPSAGITLRQRGFLRH
ncbi:MAG: hypothetical protein ACETWG_05735 [Candidatus Neomarinimicrobiota bacterium]